MAIAPPLTLTFSGSSSSSRMTGSACAAKASFSSTRSMSPTERPARSSALREAGIGPRPIVAGSTPATALATRRAIGRRPSSAARDSEVTRSAAAPSLMPLLLPAVTEPEASRLKAGFKPASCSRVVSGRGCSSRSTVVVAPLAAGTSIGTTSSAKRPAPCAAAQRWCEASANRSWSSRETPQRSTTFSAVSPIEYG